MHVALVFARASKAQVVVARGQKGRAAPTPGGARVLLANGLALGRHASGKGAAPVVARHIAVLASVEKRPEGLVDDPSHVVAPNEE